MFTASPSSTLFWFIWCLFINVSLISLSICLIYPSLLPFKFCFFCFFVPFSFLNAPIFLVSSIVSVYTFFEPSCFLLPVASISPSVQMYPSHIRQLVPCWLFHKPFLQRSLLHNTFHSWHFHCYAGLRASTKMLKILPLVHKNAYERVLSWNRETNYVTLSHNIQ